MTTSYLLNRDKGIHKLLAFCATMFLAIIVQMTIPVYAEGNYTTTSLERTIVVHADNSYDINEIWSINVLRPIHGIYRYIPMTGHLNFNYNGKRYSIATDENVTLEGVVGGPAKTTIKDGAFLIRIGDPDKMVQPGPKTYEIHYHVALQPNANPDFDLIYLELKPQSWNTPIDSMKVKVVFPKPLPTDKVTIYSGIRGVQGNTLLEGDFTKDAQGRDVYIGTAKHVPRESTATLFTMVPSGYFELPPVYDYTKIGMIIGSIFLMILSAFLWFTYGRDDSIVKTVEFYAPDDLRPMEISELMDEYPTKASFCGEIINLANKGYIAIKPIGSTANPDDFLMEALSQKAIADGKKDRNSEFEKSLMNSLFGGDPHPGKEIQLSQDDEALKGAYDMGVLNAISPSLEYFNRKSRSIQKVMTIAMVGILFLPLFLLQSLTPVNFSLTSMLASAICIFAGLNLAISTIRKRETGSAKGSRTGLLIGGIVLLFGSYLLFEVTEISWGSVGISALASISCLISAMFISFQERPRKENLTLIGRVKGFRDFLEKAERRQVERLFDQDPQYFFKVLPYLVAFGLSDKWVKEMGDLIKEVPVWYGTPNTMMDPFMMGMLMNQLTDSVTAATMPINIESSTVGGSGFDIGGGDGGFSGGGIGGGGGGDW